MRYAELKCRTHYSFLRGASHPAELVDRAAELGLEALAITDRDGVYGVPKAYSAWKALPAERPLKLIVGSELTLAGGLPRLTLLAANRAGYALMCRLLTASHEGKPKGQASLEWEKLATMLETTEFQKGREGLFVLPDASEDVFLRSLRPYFEGRLALPLTRTREDADRRREARRAEQARELGLPLVACNDVHFHEPARRRLQDTLVAIRENVRLSEAGMALFPNGERYLKSPEQMAALFEDLPGALRETLVIAERCTFSPGELRYRYPSEWIPAGRTAQEYLAELVWKGAHARYGGLVPEATRAQLEHELDLVRQLSFADYFLTIWEIVEFARGRKILCQGRGSAANSAVCYCLGITAIDPVRMNLLFERFISVERGEPPDIDVDFEHERREEVIQHIYEKYGRDRAGMVAAVITYRRRSQLRDVSKALGMEPEQASENPRVRALMEELSGFPRHLSIHSGGFTLSADPLIETVPIEPARMQGRTIVQWDKDDLAAIGLLKVDVLALGMLSALRKTLDQVGLDLYGIPPDDRPTYDMICAGDTVGVFQIESRAQMGMLKRLRPRDFYDLVIEVAIVRPGPIVGKMVHPFLRRRRGQEPVVYPHPDLVPILGRTLGVPIFQEQIMKMGIRFAGFTAGEADELRRAFGSWKSTGNLERMGTKLKTGLLESGLPTDFVERVFQQIQGFSEYGFPESHAASFALLAYVSSYLKRHHPAEFTCALLNSQPMGFYANHTLVDDAKRAGVGVLPLCPNRSEWVCRLEGPGRIRVGFCTVRGLGSKEGARIMAERAQGGRFASLGDFVYRLGLRPEVCELLAMGGAFEGFGLTQRQALWELLAYQNLVAQKAERAACGEQFSFFGPSAEPGLFAGLSEPEAILADYRSFGLSARGHPMAALRRSMGAQLPKATSGGIKRAPNGRRVKVAGLVIARQRPQTAKGTVFATLEDEDGFTDLLLREEVFEKYEEIFSHNAFLVISGRVQTDGAAVNVIVSHVEVLPGRKGSAGVGSHDFH